MELDSGVALTCKVIMKCIKPSELTPAYAEMAHVHPILYNFAPNLKSN
jgi:hypothetical protein